MKALYVLYVELLPIPSFACPSPYFCTSPKLYSLALYARYFRVLTSTSGLLVHFVAHLSQVRNVIKLRGHLQLKMRAAPPWLSPWPLKGAGNVLGR